ncbi:MULTISPECIES: flagellar biosynthetic protein FliQ [Acidocella]|uniref:flagellar biosynthetic protein FliQ n=1 Tax=Acidocella TaxID=50709 RepID=UPI00028D612C|nr:MULTISPECIES: flagellar biosynthetic protein FliQ [Acidocella]EKM99660.1 flagellar biosynthetic protein fliq [Acidocella sp. MX-AZ02]WBO58283.1 flagellar biosynthetic protein FliQ [Acidocella sp. MX-AZ03]
MSAASVNSGAWLAFAELAGPVLLLMLVIGLAVGLVQTATQVREASIPFVLKLGGLAALISAGGTLMLGGIERYSTALFHAIPGLLHG